MWLVTQDLLHHPAARSAVGRLRLSENAISGCKRHWPSLLDGWWYYGPEMVSIFASIRDGRPHGMPAFGSQMTTEQIWQLRNQLNIQRLCLLACDVGIKCEHSHPQHVRYRRNPFANTPQAD